MLLRTLVIAASGIVVGLAQPAMAAEKLFDATSAPAVASALQEAGFKAILKTGDDGDPYILSSANGEDFTIEFYNCKDGHCTSMQFASSYKAEALWTPALTNEWNATKRFLRIGVDSKGRLREFIDVSSVGQLTQANFADIVDWYQSMDAELAKFIGEKRAAAK